MGSLEEIYWNMDKKTNGKLEHIMLSCPHVMVIISLTIRYI